LRRWLVPILSNAVANEGRSRHWTGGGRRSDRIGCRPGGGCARGSTGCPTPGASAGRSLSIRSQPSNHGWRARCSAIRPRLS
jgi:hypothetical protein